MVAIQQDLLRHWRKGPLRQEGLDFAEERMQTALDPLGLTDGKKAYFGRLAVGKTLVEEHFTVEDQEADSSRVLRLLQLVQHGFH